MQVPFLVPSLSKSTEETLIGFKKKLQRKKLIGLKKKKRKKESFGESTAEREHMFICDIFLNYRPSHFKEVQIKYKEREQKRENVVVRCRQTKTQTN